MKHGFLFHLFGDHTTGEMRQLKWRSIFWIALLVLLLFSVTPRGYAQDLTAGHAEVFLISGYYSPLPGQSRYATGSYEKDVRLNGEGVHAADGSKVYPGMIAAPPNIPFGTKMEIPRYGIFAVHDRGGAIKNNRLDIWMGSGEEGLARALAWGLRSVEVRVYGINESIAENVDLGSFPKADLSRLPIAGIGPGAIVRSASFSLGIGDTGEQVIALQKALARVGLFSAQHTGYFGDETANAIRILQKDAGIIDSDESPGAGVFGPRTQAALASQFMRARNAKLALIPLETLARSSRGASVSSLSALLLESGFLSQKSDNFDAKLVDAVTRFQIDMEIIRDAKEKGAGVFGPKSVAAMKNLIIASWGSGFDVESGGSQFASELALNDSSGEVARLQEVLGSLNFFRRAPTGYFGKSTEHAVFKFQQAFGIVKNESASGAGIVGPVTREVLNGLQEKRYTLQQSVASTTTQQRVVAARIDDEKALLERLFAGAQFQSGLGLGARGAEVEVLQKLLRRLGFFPGRVTTQYFGDITKKSLVAFQKSHALAPSGALDELTALLINRIAGA